MPAGLWLSVAGDVAVAAAFARLGARFFERAEGARGKEPLLAFATGWLLLSLQSALAALRVSIVAAGQAEGGIVAALLVAESTTGVLALACLGAYLLRLYHGRERGLAAGGAALAALGAFLAWVPLSHGVTGATAAEWTTSATYATPVPAWEQALAAVLPLVALVGIASGFGVVARRRARRAQRVRARSVAGALGLLALVGLGAAALQGDTPIAALLGLLRLASVAWVWSAFFPTRLTGARAGTSSRRLRQGPS